MNENFKIGKKLKVLIATKYKSNKLFAEKHGMNYTQLSNYLNDNVPPSLKLVGIVLNDFPEVDLNWLLREAENAELNHLNETNADYKRPMDNDEIIDKMEGLISALRLNLAQK